MADSSSTRTLRYVVTADAGAGVAEMGKAAAASEAMGKRITASLQHFAGFIGGELGSGIDKLLSGFDALGEHGADAGTKLLALGTGVTGLGLALTSMGANEKRATDQLRVAIEGTGHSYAEFSEKIEQTVKQQENFGNSTEDTKEALTRLTQATQDPNKALAQMALVADLAASKHESLAAAASQVAKILAGSGGKILHQYGIDMQTNADGTKNVDLALQQLSQRLRGQAAASVDNFNGQLDVVLTKLKDWAGEIGQRIGPALTIAGTVTSLAADALAIYEAAVTRAAAANAAQAASAEAATVANEALAASDLEVAAAGEAAAAGGAAAAAGGAAAAAGGAAAATGLGAAIAAGLGAVPVLGAVVIGLLALGAALKGLGLEFPKLGVSVNTFTHTASGGGHQLSEIADTLSSQLIPAMDSAHRATGPMIDSIIRLTLQSKPLQGLLDGTGETISSVTDALSSSPQAWNRWIAGVEQSMRASGKDKAVVDFQVGALRDLRGAWQSSADAAEINTDAVNNSIGPIETEVKWLKEHNLTLEQAKKKYSDAVTQAHSFTAELGYMSKALDDLSNNHINAALGQLRLTDAWAHGTDVDSELTRQVKEHGSSLKENTADGRSNREWLLQQIQAINTQAVSYAKSSGSIALGTGSLKTNIEALKRSATEAGLTDDQVNALIKTYAATPGDVKTSIEEQGADAVVSKLGDIEFELAKIAKEPWTVDVNFTSLDVGHRGDAAGGLITGRGGPTEDNLLRRVSSGEFIVNAAQTKRWLPVLRAINTPGYATGGVVENSDILGNPNGRSVPSSLDLTLNDAINLGALQQLLNSGLTKARAAVASVGAGASVSANVSAEQQFAASLFGAYGWGAGELSSLIALWNGESGWNPAALNPSSGAFGIPQSLPASKMASAGADWATNPATQIRWGENYINDVYGSPSAAYGAWLSRSPHWYGDGAWNVPADQLAFLHQKELVMDAQSADKFRAGGFGGITIGAGAITIVAAPGMSEQQIARYAFDQLRRWVEDERRREAKGARA